MAFKYKDFVDGPLLDTADYAGAASMFITTDGYSRLNTAISKSSGAVHKELLNIIPGALANIKIDFIIDSIRVKNTEVDQLTEYMGDYFNLQFYGRQIPIVNISGVLSMLRGFDTKRRFMLLYTDIFRISKVARFGIVPYISFNNPNTTTMAGAFLDMNIDRTSDIQDVAMVSFNFLIFQYLVQNIQSGSPEVSITYSNLVGV